MNSTTEETVNNETHENVNTGNQEAMMNELLNVMNSMFGGNLGDISQFQNMVQSTPDNLSFGEAMLFLQEGKFVARKGWNGKNMYLFLAPKSWLKAIEETKWSDYPVDSFICMKTASDTIQPGWLASQADILANDWCVVDIEENDNKESIEGTQKESSDNSKLEEESDTQEDKNSVIEKTED